LGNIRGRQYLLPVSFNLPALIFSSEQKSNIPDDFFIDLDQVQRIARDFNNQTKGNWTKMGFSPRWDPEFLYMTAILFNTRFEEGSALFTWNEQGLSNALTYIRNWSTQANSSTAAEEDFKFKYLYDPPYKQVTGGRSLFSYMSSEELFVLPKDKLQNIDFRWISREGKTPVKDSIIYGGICKSAGDLEAAEAFLTWFFSEKTQRALLERSKNIGIMDQSFGIAGGFSSIKNVNEKDFPLFYPSILGHMPQSEALLVPRILPNRWESLKADIVIPYLQEAVASSGDGSAPTETLVNRLNLWLKGH
jgi:ABC-type glycerol-3-phosphate transport system substrate-binding protein